MNAITTYAHFFWAGLANRRQTGALLPSQRFLIDRMIAPVHPGYRGRILELGAGNGALTRRLAARCPAARIVACEINPTLAHDNRKLLRRAGVNGRVEVVTEAAEKVLARLSQTERDRPAYIISGIPLGNLPGEKTCALVEAIHRALAEDGVYIQFQHSLLDRKRIKAQFSDLRTVPVLLNIPPAVVYFARK